MRSLKKFAFLLATLVLLCSGISTTQAQDEPNPDDGQIFLPLITQGQGQSVSLEQQALTAAAARINVPASELTAVHSTQANYPLSGQSAHHFKFMDQTGAVHGITLAANGQELDAAQLFAAEQAAHTTRFGRLAPALATLLANNTNQEAIQVIIWLNAPEYVGLERPLPATGALNAADLTEQGLSEVDRANKALAQSGIASDTGIAGQADAEAAAIESAAVESAAATAETVRVQEQQAAFLAQVDAQRAAHVAQVTAPVVERIRQLGHAVSADTYAPALYARLTPAAIRDIAQWDEVNQIYLDETSTSLLDIARQTIYAHTVNSRGITGSGIRVAQIEVGGRIATSNPYLSGVVQNTTYVCSSASSHATGVAGIIRSTHSTVRGIAPGATLWAGGSCGGWDSELQNRSTAAADWGALALNLSWGRDNALVPGVNDRFYDNMVINRYRTVVVAAGNAGSGCGGNGNVIMPALAYNVISVGNFNDNNSVSWSGDTMSSCSSWRDPISTNGDREKPEVAAPGTTINSTTNASPWTGNIGSGTSFAAPMVTGAAALLIQRSSGLANWPEAIKAILMATAVHNIEGAARLSESDGAGAVVLDYADDVARGARGTWGAQSYTCSTTSPLTVATMSLTSGRRLRAVIAWDNDPNYASYSSRPGADLDLQVLNASGSVVASSASFDNTYEIVDFTPSSSGSYRLRVIRYRCDYSPRWLGWAWFH